MSLMAVARRGREVGRDMSFVGVEGQGLARLCIDLQWYSLTHLSHPHQHATLDPAELGLRERMK